MTENISQLDTSAAYEERLKGLEKELRNQTKETKWVQRVMTSIFIVVVIAFIGMLFTVYGIIQQYLGTQTATYQNLVDKINTQDTKINEINNGITNNSNSLNKLEKSRFYYQPQ